MKKQRALSNLAAITVITASLGLVACGTGPEPETMEQNVDQGIEQLNEDLATEMDKSRVEMTEELRSLRSDIDAYQVRIEKKLEDKSLKPEERAELEAKHTAYQEQVARIDRATSDLGMATRETWVDVKQGTRSTMDEIGDWFKKQAENVDEKTDADNDKDGH